MLFIGGMRIEFLSNELFGHYRASVHPPWQEERRGHKQSFHAEAGNPEAALHAMQLAGKIEAALAELTNLVN